MFQRVFFRLALVALFALVATTAHVTLAAPVVTTNISHGALYTRMISADEYKVVGFKGILLRGEIYLYDPTKSPRSYKGTSIFVPCSVHLTRAALLELSAAPIKGLLYVTCTDHIHNERALSQLASTVESDIALYAMPEGLEATQLLEHLQQAPLAITAGVNMRTAALYTNATLPHVALSSQILYKPKEIRASGRDENVYRVLVTANADTLGLAPTSLSTGGASGAVATVELYRRLLDTVAGDENLRPFVASLLLGTTARTNYVGTSAWLAERTEEEMNNYRMVVCLDELLSSQDAGSEPVLYMHVQDSFMKRVDGKKLVELAKATAASMDVELKVQSAKTNFQHYDLRFEHEVFANRQVAAATFSAHRSHQVEQIYRDSRPPLTEENAQLLAKRVAFVHQYLLALADVPAEKATAAAKTWIGSAAFMQGLLTYAAQTPRSPVARDGTSLVRFMETVELQMKQAARSVRHLAHVNAVTKLATGSIQVPGIEFYGPYEQELKAFVSKPFVQELLYAIVIVAVVLAFSYNELGLSGMKEAVLPTEEEESQ